MSRSCTESPGRDRAYGLLLAALVLALPARAAAPVTEKDSSGLAGRVERLERQLQNQGLVDLLQQVKALQQEVNRLRGELDVQNNTIAQMRERERALHADMDRRLQALESGGTAPAAETAEPDTAAVVDAPPLESMAGVAPEDDATAGTEADSALTLETVALPAAAAATAAGSAADAAAGAVPAPPAVAVPAAAAAAGTALGAAAGAVPEATDAAGAAAAGSTDQADYDRAFWLLKQARYEEAIPAFRTYRAAWPRGRNSDNAQYWLGEAYHATRDYDQALIEYERVISEFPGSQKITHALLKSGYCLQELGRADEARARLRDLATRYPGTTAARLAEERLRTLAAASAQ